MVDWGPWWFLATASYWWLRRGRLASWLDCTTRRDPTLVWPLSADDWWGSLEQNTRLELFCHGYRIPCIFIIRFSPIYIAIAAPLLPPHHSDWNSGCGSPNLIGHDGSTFVPVTLRSTLIDSLLYCCVSTTSHKISWHFSQLSMSQFSSFWKKPPFWCGMCFRVLTFLCPTLLHILWGR